MKKTKSSLDKNSKIIYGTAALIVAAVVFIAGFLAWKQNKEEKAKITRGTAYLESLANQEVESISERIDSIRAKQSLELMSADENAVWRGFENALILGDSRGEGFLTYELLLENQVIAEKGRKITDVLDEIEKVKTIGPKQIFLCFGLNDIKYAEWADPAAYAASYQEVVTTLKQELPGTSISVNSILPAVGSGLSEHESYSRIPDYNAALKAMAEANECRYIDNTAVIDAHSDLYEPDGLHFQKEFYKYWAANMLTEVKEQ